MNLGPAVELELLIAELGDRLALCPEVEDPNKFTMRSPAGTEVTCYGSEFRFRADDPSMWIEFLPNEDGNFDYPGLAAFLLALENLRQQNNETEAAKQKAILERVEKNRLRFEGLKQKIALSIKKFSDRGDVVMAHGLEFTNSGEHENQVEVHFNHSTRNLSFEVADALIDWLILAYNA